MVHVDEGVPCKIGSPVAVGHRAIIHGCTVEDDTLAGMGAVLLNGVEVGTGSLVAAGAVVREGTVIPPGSVVVGGPGPDRPGRYAGGRQSHPPHVAALRPGGSTPPRGRRREAPRNPDYKYVMLTVGRAGR